MRRMIKCVDTRPAKKSPVDRHKPRLVGERRDMLKKYGNRAFLLPKGTEARPGVPSFPVVSAKTGCFHCGMMRMAYTRLGAAINRTRNRAYRQELMKKRERLIRLARSFADKSDPTNRCNFSYRASKRYL